MLLFWKIRYLDSRDRQYKDRELVLDTAKLDAATGAAVELCDRLQDNREDRRWLKFRPLFNAVNLSDDEFADLFKNQDRFATVCIHDYFEDEKGTLA